MNTTPGILAIWNDCAPGREAEYEGWYRGEHLSERVGIEGFRSGWRYVAVDAEPRFFTHYVTSSPAVLFSPAYRARLDAPTELTRHVMSSGVFLNASRTECERRFRRGHSRGSYATVTRIETQTGTQIETGADAAALITFASAAAERDDVLRAEVWVAVPRSAAASSTEQSLRPPDATITACLLVETSEEGSARAAAETARAGFPQGATTGVYRLLVGLSLEDLDASMLPGD